MIDWAPFREIVKRYRTFVLTSHVRPDSDALGSELAMANLLESLGKRVRIVNAQSTPPHLRFLDPTGRIEVMHEQVTIQDLEETEVMIVLDTSAWVQLGTMADVLRESRAVKVVIDHHVSEDDMGAILLKNEKAEATGRLVIEAAEQLGAPVSAETATAAFAAIATDTGWFRFNSVTGDSYRLAGKLVDAGASPDAIYRQLYEQDSLERLHLRGAILARIEVELDGRLVHTYVTQDDFRQTGAIPSDTEDVVNMTLGVAGTEVAVIFVEQAKERVKVSFRSRSPVDCSQIAAEFGGGGHRAAAGAMLSGHLDEVRARVLDAVRAAM